MSAPEAELPLSLDIADAGEAWRVHLTGELDMETAPMLLQTLVGIDTDRPVLVDMTGLDFIDSSGIRVLTDARAELGRRGSTLCVHEAPAFVREVFTVAGVHDLLCADDGHG